MQLSVYVEASETGEVWASMGKFQSPRDYLLFGVIAGVKLPLATNLLYPLRGVPKDLGWIAKDDYCIKVTDREYADELVNDGLTEYWDESKRFLVNMDIHHGSWLTLGEYRNVLREVKNCFDEYVAIEAFMEALEKRGRMSRLVFWFSY